MSTERTDRRDRRRVAARHAAWVAILAAVAVALVISLVGGSRQRTAADRIAAVAQTIRCPTCQGQSAAESDAPASRAVRVEIDRRLRSGQSADEIRAYFVDRYGPDILLSPPASGVSVLVWVLPGVALAAGATVVAIALRRRPRSAATEADRVIVAAALARADRREGEPA